MKRKIALIISLYVLLINAIYGQSGTATQIVGTCTEYSGQLEVSITVDQNVYPPPYTYTIYNEKYDYSDVQTINNTSTIFTNLPKGEYQITVDLSLDTQLKFCGEILSIISFTFDEAVNRPACGDVKGFEKIKRVNGVFNSGLSTDYFTFEWSMSNEDGYAASAYAGIYTVKVTEDLSECSNEEEFEIEDVSFTVDEDVSQPDCNNGLGAVVLSMKNMIGFPSSRTYNVMWSNGSSGKSISGLASGDYTYTVSDVENPNCSVVNTVTIDSANPNTLITGVVTNGIQGGPGGPTGRIDQTINSSGTFSFLWVASYGGFTSNKEDLINIPSGTYYVTITHLESGCIYKKEYTVKNIDCKNKKIVIAHIIVKDRVCPAPYQFGGQHCQGCPKDVLVTIDNIDNITFPCTIKITGGDNFTYTQVIASKSEFPSSQWKLGMQIPTSLNPYKCTITDVCNASASKDFNTCATCLEPIYNNDDSNNHLMTFEDRFIIRFTYPCKFEKSWPKRSKIQFGNSPKELTVGDGLKYTINWPNNTKTVIENPLGTQKGPKIISGPKSYDFVLFDFNNPFTFTIDRNDGCSRSFTLNLGNSSENVLIDNRSGALTDWAPLKYYTTSIDCKPSCNIIGTPGGGGAPGTVPGTYVRFCDFKDRLKAFKYYPNSLTSPCTGGGKIKGIFIENGVPKEVKLIVPPSAFVISEKYYLTDEHQIEPSNIRVGGGCGLDPYSIINFHLDKDFYVNWYSISEDLDDITTGHEGCATLSVTGGPEVYDVIVSSKYGGELTVTYPSGVSKRLVLGAEVRHLKVSNYDFYGTIKFEFDDENKDCADPIEIVKVDKVECDITVLMSDNNANSFFLTMKVGPGVADGKYSIKFIDELTKEVIDYSELGQTLFNYKAGDNIHEIRHNAYGTGLSSSRRYKIIISFDNECKDEEIFNFTPGSLTDDPPAGITCDDKIFSFIGITSEKYLTPVIDNQNRISKMELFNNLENSKSYFERMTNLDSSFKKMIDATYDKESNLFMLYNGDSQFLSKYEDGHYNKINVNLENSRLILDQNSLFLSGFDQTSGLFQILEYNKNLVLQNVFGYNINRSDLKFIKFLKNSVIYQNTNNELFTIRCLQCPSNKLLDFDCVIKDIQINELGNIILLSENNGICTTTTLDQQEYKNGIVSKIDENGNLLKRIRLNNQRDETVEKLTMLDNHIGLYQGTYVDTVFLGYDNFPTIIDSCNFIEKLDFESDICDSIIIHLIDSIGICEINSNQEFNQNLTVQKYDPVVGWTFVTNFNGRFEPEDIGVYRLYNNDNKCGNNYSNSIDVKCIAKVDSCHLVPLDIVYNENTQKFIYFELDKDNHSTITSTYISPVTYETLSMFLEWTCEDIVINTFQVDEQQNVYVYGHDRTNVFRTRILKYNYSTKQIIWSTWVENFRFESVIPYAQSNNYVSIAGVDNTNKWFLRGYHKLDGVLLFATPQQMKSTPGKLFGIYNHIRWLSENSYVFIPNAPEVIYYSPTVSWVRPLPPVINVRSFTKNRMGYITVGGDFSGTFVINDTSYTSGIGRNLVFITFNESGQIIHVKVIKSNKRYVLKRFTTDGYFNYAYCGYEIKDSTIVINNSTVIDSLAGDPGVCAHVGGFVLPSPNLGFRTIETDLESVSIFPNPTTNGITIEYYCYLPEEMSVMVYNSLGNKILDEKIGSSYGLNRHYIEQFEKLPSGVYVVKLTSACGKSVKRVIKLRN